MFQLKPYFAPDFTEERIWDEYNVYEKQVDRE